MQDKLDLKVKLGELELQNPVMTASGTFGYAKEFENLVARKFDEAMKMLMDGE